MLLKLTPDDDVVAADVVVDFVAGMVL